MSDPKPASRRQFLFGSLGAAGALFHVRSALAQMCGLTPPQTEGPFYPLSKITGNRINDLTLRPGHSSLAKGEVVYITGTVVDEDCQPLKGALVEIWQAAASGRYDHPSDDSGLELDPNFKNWGEFITGEDGRYAFKTIVPGHYPADVDWERPPHVHYKISKLGHHELTTQLYFTPSSFTGDKAALVEKLNRLDKILLAVPESERDSVIVEFKPVTQTTVVGTLFAYHQDGSLVAVGDITAQNGEKVGNFDLTVKTAR